MNDFLSRAARWYQGRMPERIRKYLNDRGIPDETIDRFQIGWNGERITIPIRNREGKVVFFKLARDPEVDSSQPKMVATPRSRMELYGWGSLLRKPKRIIICEGEYDRLVLESRGFPAVTSTGGALSFKKDWVEYFREVKEIFLCFDRDDTGRKGAEKAAEMIPGSKIVTLPEEVDEHGDVTDFFIRLGDTKVDFEKLLANARSPEPREVTTRIPVRRCSAEVPGVSIEKLVRCYIALRKVGRQWMGRCPFHEDHNPSFAVYPETQSFYCFGCRRHGDTIGFLMQIEELNYPQAKRVLDRLIDEK